MAATRSLLPVMCLPSTAVTTSPVFRPAEAAGLPAVTEPTPAPVVPVDCVVPTPRYAWLTVWPAPSCRERGGHVLLPFDEVVPQAGTTSATRPGPRIACDDPGTFLRAARGGLRRSRFRVRHLDVRPAVAGADQ